MITLDLKRVNVHCSVLKDELLRAFSWSTGGLIDCTLGFGGHTLAFLESAPNTQVYAFDRDKSAIALAQQRLEKYRSHIKYYHCPFSLVLTKLEVNELQGVRGIIADIGVSSMQLDNANRGFNFHSLALDMRMDKDSNLDAKRVLNSYSLRELEEIFKNYGEIKQYKKLARLIVDRRAQKGFESCLELSELIESHFPRIGGLHPATLAFQAIRIEVNDELNQLRALLQSIQTAFEGGALEQCKVGIITFHSLEDRIVKQYFKQWSKSCICPEESYKCQCGNNHALGEILTKKPITPTSKEIAHNKRARSAKLRIFALGAKYV